MGTSQNLSYYYEDCNMIFRGCYLIILCYNRIFFLKRCHLFVNAEMIKISLRAYNSIYTYKRGS